MMIVAFGKSFTVSDPIPKKLIMNTLARAAIERDKAMEDGEEMQLLCSGGRDQTDFAGSRMNTMSRNRHNIVMSSPALSGGGGVAGGGKQKVTFEDVDGGTVSGTLAANSPR